MSSADPNPFNTRPNNYLGNDYMAYQSRLTAYAIKKPSEFITLKQTLLQKIKSDQIDVIYEMFSSLLREGKLKNGTILTPLLPREVGQVNYPDQKISQIVLSLSVEFDKILKEVLDIIIPPEVSDVLGNTISKSKI